MKLEKAKEILKLELIGPACLSNPDLKDATRIGIEAIEKRQDISERFPHLPHLRLPSETPPIDSP